MSRCSRKAYLEVYHIDATRGNSIENARVLCQPCHARVSGNEKPGITPPDFSVETMAIAFLRAGHQCECTNPTGCHENDRVSTVPILELSDIQRNRKEFKHVRNATYRRYAD